jgi:hypothetical protein
LQRLWTLLQAAQCEFWSVQTNYSISWKRVELKEILEAKAICSLPKIPSKTGFW